MSLNKNLKNKHIDEIFEFFKQDNLVAVYNNGITEIDGITMKERVNTLKRYCVVSEENKYAHKISISVLRTKEEKALVKVIRDNKEINLNVTTSKYFYQYKNPF